MLRIAFHLCHGASAKKVFRPQEQSISERGKLEIVNGPLVARAQHCDAAIKNETRLGSFARHTSRACARMA
jgi:hypothetical protein